MIGVLTYLGLTILGVEYAILLALLAGIMEIIPIFGPIISAVPAVIIAFIGGIALADPGVGSAVAVILFYVLVQVLVQYNHPLKTKNRNYKDFLKYHKRAWNEVLAVAHESY